MNTKVSCIVTSFDNYQLTWNLIDSLYRTERREHIEIVLVDNGSTDTTSTLAPFVDRFLINDTPRNLARSLNLGVSAASRDLLFILNNDIVMLSSGWASRFEAAVHQRGAQMVAPLTVEGSGFHPRIYDVLQDITSEATPALLRLDPIAHLEMACMLVTRDVVDRCGPFDESLPLWYFDLEFLVAIQRAAIPVVRCRDIVARHFGNASIRYAPGAPINEFLRTEYEQFCARHSAHELEQLGLIYPAEFGPVDLTAGLTTVTIGNLESWWKIWRGGTSKEAS